MMGSQWFAETIKILSCREREENSHENFEFWHWELDTAWRRIVQSKAAAASSLVTTPWRQMTEHEPEQGRWARVLSGGAAASRVRRGDLSNPFSPKLCWHRVQLILVLVSQRRTCCPRRLL
jgi:hypothetical protein